MIEAALAGVDLAPGDHICALYVGQAERDQALLPFMRAGLGAGHKCVCLVNAPPPGTMADVIADDALGDIHGYIASGQLEVKASDEAYLPGGAWDTRAMLDFWESISMRTASAGFPFARLAGEMPETMRTVSGIDAFMDYESELNRYVPNYPQVMLCMYDLDVFGGGILVNLLRSHPRILLGGMIIDNPYWITPDDYLTWRDHQRG